TMNISRGASPDSDSTVVPPNCSVKYTGNFTPSGNGNGPRSIGTGVIVIDLIGSPSTLRSTAFFGICTSKPGSVGVVAITSFLVGDFNGIAFLVSSTGMNTVYCNALAPRALGTSTASIKKPYVVFAVLAGRQSTISVLRPCGTPDRTKRPVSSVTVATFLIFITTPGSGHPSNLSTWPASAVAPAVPSSAP